MKPIDRIESEIEKTLGALDGLERAHPEPYFWTRLRARMERENSPSASGWVNVLGQARLQAGLISLFLVINLFTYFSFWAVPERQEEVVDYIVQDYSLDYVDIYDQNLE